MRRKKLILIKEPDNLFSYLNKFMNKLLVLFYEN